ncbi:MAG: CRISPR-associated protein Cas10/Csm1 [Syntrophomonadaceae bacterium]|nr:CRISPR-associated protein Cas10/Csm1 [Bacillota bacterium]
MDTVVFQTIVTAGLLHDIGKFLQRGDFGTLTVTGKHPKVSRDFVTAHRDFFSKFCDIDLLTELVARHHESAGFPPELQVSGAAEEIRPYAYIVSRADNYSSAERDDGPAEVLGKGFKKTALAAVFSRLELSIPRGKASSYKLERLSPAAGFPVLGVDALDETPYKNHLKGFGEEFSRFVKDPSLNCFDKFYARLLSILQSYTWCVPSSTQDAVPDVSLYDHLKTTSAIAAASARYHEATTRGVTIDDVRKFRLVVGDLSGIQKYIFRATQKGYGKIAKRLRARSFFLGVLSDLVSHMLIHAFKLPVANIIMSSGGKFYVLVPNTADSSDMVVAIQRRIDAELLERFHGELALNLASVAFSGDDFNDFGSIMAEAGRKLAGRKTAPFAEILHENGRWDETAFVSRYKESLAACPGCGKVHPDVGVCDDCLQDERIGGKLPRAKYISFFRGDAPSSATEVISGYSFTVDRDIVKHNPPPYLVYNLNEKGKPTENPELVKYMAKHVPAQEDQAVGFDEIAESAKGIKLLGCLKADVDHLGMLFLLGLRDVSTERNHASISRVSTMSRMLELFFSGWIEKLFDEPAFHNCYTVYSGGDDLLVVGPWERIFELAGRINSDFRQFIAGNPNVTLSAGLSLFKARFPIDSAVEQAERFLADAKEKVNSTTGTSRDQITLFGQTIKWDQYAYMKPQALKLAKWLEENRINSGLVYRLQWYSRMYRDATVPDDAGKIHTDGWKFVSLLEDDLSRNVRGRIEQEVADWLKACATAPYRTTALLQPITTYALYSNRGGIDHGR